MFEKNDKSLNVLRVMNNVFAAIMTVGCVVGGIAMCCIDESLIAYGVVLLIVGSLFVWLGWVVMRAVLGCMCDIKLIRNKLYNEDNVGLAPFIGTDVALEENTATAVSTQQKTKEPQKELTEEQEQLLAELKVVYSEGAISREQYEETKQRILQK